MSTHQSKRNGTTACRVLASCSWPWPCHAPRIAACIRGREETCVGWGGVAGEGTSIVAIHRPTALHDPKDNSREQAHTSSRGKAIRAAPSSLRNREPQILQLDGWLGPPQLADSTPVLFLCGTARHTLSGLEARPPHQQSVAHSLRNIHPRAPCSAHPRARRIWICCPLISSSHS